jgi:hypothetical protein
MRHSQGVGATSGVIFSKYVKSRQTVRLVTAGTAQPIESTQQLCAGLEGAKTFEFQRTQLPELEQL